MRSLEVTFKSANGRHYAKNVTALVGVPDELNGQTGVLLFNHGWGGNRFQHRDKLEYSCDRFNFIGVATEYRMSGYDFDAVTGTGYYQPYDASFMQTFDTLNALRQVLALFPGVNRRRLAVYGGSQGGHIALLSVLFAPATFAWCYTSSAMTWLDPPKLELTGREFAPWELEARNVIHHAEQLRCPLFMEHGTADENVSHLTHAVPLIDRLTELGRPPRELVYYEGGSHSLAPAISKIDAYKAMIEKCVAAPLNPDSDDFAARRLVTLDCGEKSLRIDWSKPADSAELFTWV